MQEMQEAWVQCLGWEDLLEEGVAPHSVFLPGKFHGQRRLPGYSPWGCKDLDMTEHMHTHRENTDLKAATHRQFTSIAAGQAAQLQVISLNCLLENIS